MDFKQETLKGVSSIHYTWFGVGSGTKIHFSPVKLHLEAKTSQSVNGLTLSLTKEG